MAAREALGADVRLEGQDFDAARADFAAAERLLKERPDNEAR